MLCRPIWKPCRNVLHKVPTSAPARDWRLLKLWKMDDRASVSDRRCRKSDSDCRGPAATTDMRRDASTAATCASRKSDE